MKVEKCKILAELIFIVGVSALVATSSLINSRFITYGCRRHYPPFGLPHHVSTVSSLHPQLDGKGLRDQDEGDLENHRLRVLDLHPLHACTKAI